MPGSALRFWRRRIVSPIRKLLALYTLLLAAFTLARWLRLGGLPLLDLAHTFAPYLYMPLLLTFPLSIVVTRPSAFPIARARKRLARPSKPGRAAGRPRPARWPALLQIGLMALGLYWFALPASYQPVAPPTGPTFHVITFNVQGSNVELGAATDWLLAAAPDVIILQETTEGYDARLAPLYAAYAHEDHIDGSSARVFSRYRILERAILSIEDEPGREALRLLLDQDGRSLALYALHLTLPLRPPAALGGDIGPEALLRYDESRRNRQIRRLLDLLEAESEPYIVAGDFNMSDSSLIYAEIAARLDDAWRGAGNGAGRSWPIAEEIGLPRVIRPFLRIDYIWHSPGLRPTAATLGPPIGSDHLPLSVVFEWPAA